MLDPSLPVEAQVSVSTRVLVPAAKAYGAHDPAQVQRVNRALLPV